MALADRTYFFRASTGLDERVTAAHRTYAALAAEPDMAAHVSRELELGLQRRLRDEPEHGRPSRVLRAITEAFVEAVERAAGEGAAIEALRAFDAADSSGERERRAMLRSSAVGRGD